MSSPRRSFSFSFDSNPLAKRMYNLADTTLSRTPMSSPNKPAPLAMFSADNKKRALPKRSFLNTFYSRFEPNPQTTILPPALETSRTVSSVSIQSLTQPKIKPKFTLLKLHRHRRQQTNPQIVRKQTDIKKWENINKRLEKLLPPPVLKLEKKKPPKQPVVITKDKVRELTEELMKHIEHFYNIYPSAQKMTSFLKDMEGFNQTIANVLMRNGLFKRIQTPQEIYRHFEIFRPQQLRSEDFSSLDLKLHTALDYFCIKMQQRVKGCHNDFSQRLKDKIAVHTMSLEAKIKILEKRNIRQHTSTLKFLAAKRLYLGKYTKEETIKKLEDLGVKFSVKERMRDKVITSREVVSEGITDTLLKYSRTLNYRVQSPNKFYGPNAQHY